MERKSNQTVFVTLPVSEYQLLQAEANERCISMSQLMRIVWRQHTGLMKPERRKRKPFTPEGARDNGTNN